MKSTFITLVLCGLMTILAPTAHAQITLEGITLKKNVSHEGQTLMLNGGGVRTKLFFDLYVGGLYLKQKSSNAVSIIKADEPMMMQLNIISGLITSDKMVSATMEGFEKSTKGNMASVQKEIDAFIAIFREEIKEGDVFDIMYVPDTGTIVYKNGKLAGTVQGLTFKQYLFGIWLGDDPADDDLKEGMLGE